MLAQRWKNDLGTRPQYEQKKLSKHIRKKASELTFKAVTGAFFVEYKIIDTFI